MHRYWSKRKRKTPVSGRCPPCCCQRSTTNTAEVCSDKTQWISNELIYFNPNLVTGINDAKSLKNRLLLRKLLFLVIFRDWLERKDVTFELFPLKMNEKEKSRREEKKKRRLPNSKALYPLPQLIGQRERLSNLGKTHEVSIHHPYTKYIMS